MRLNCNRLVERNKNEANDWNLLSCLTSLLNSKCIYIYIYIYIYIMNWSTERFTNLYILKLFISVFLTRVSCYLQKMFDNFGWFLVYIVVIVLMGFCMIDFLLLLSFSLFSSSSFSKSVFCVCLFFVDVFFLWLKTKSEHAWKTESLALNRNRSHQTLLPSTERTLFHSVVSSEHV